MTADNGTRKKSSKAFHEMLNDGGITPAGFLLDELRNEENTIGVRREIAKYLCQYQLPRLNSIEADVTTTERTHEDWLDVLGSDLTDEDLAEAGNDNTDDERRASVGHRE